MIDFLKLVFAGIVGGFLVLGGSFFFPHAAVSPESLGASVAANVTTIGNPWQFNNTVTIGTSGSSFSKVLRGTAILVAPTYVSLAATTTLVADIAVSGVVSGDYVDVQFATTTVAASGAGWIVQGASASTTAGFITVQYLNLTGAAATIPASVASTTKYLVIH